MCRVHALLTLKAATEVGGISLDNFVELAKLHPTFLQSCRDFQTLLRQRIVSWEFWMKHSKKRIQNYGGRTYIALPLIFKKQEAPLRRPDMPRCVKRLGVRQEEDSEGGDEDEEWGENAVKPFHQLVEELQENDVDSLKPRSMYVLRLLDSYIMVLIVLSVLTENQLMDCLLYFTVRICRSLRSCSRAIYRLQSRVTPHYRLCK